MRVQQRPVKASLSSDAVFEAITKRVEQDQAKAKSVNAVIEVNITKDGKHAKKWTLDLKNAKVYEGVCQNGKPVTTLTTSDENFVQLAMGKLQPNAAFMKGLLKISGNIMVTQKLVPLLKAEAKL